MKVWRKSASGIEMIEDRYLFSRHILYIAYCMYINTKYRYRAVGDINTNMSYFTRTLEKSTVLKLTRFMITHKFIYIPLRGRELN